jgi:putative peptide zinc metalloprotease protein
LTDYNIRLGRKLEVTRYPADALVSIYPFTRQSEGDEFIIGRVDTNIFLALPSDAIELLDYLAAGNTIGQAQRLYQQKYHELPDIEGLLEVLEENDFVNILSSKQIVLPTHTKQPKQTNHFTWISESFAKKIFSQKVLIGSVLVIVLALAALVFQPGIMPGYQAFVFTKNVTMMTLILTGINVVAVFLHEMAHLVAAKAVGVSCQLRLSNRLWILVAETDMTGIWGVPRNQRYLPFLAGPLLDVVLTSVLLLILFAQQEKWVAINPIALQLIQAIVLSYLLGLIWQCYFFVRTDFYYVIANFFRCRSLMKDTKVFLQNQLFKLFKFSRIADQSSIPRGEMRVIRCYSVIYVLGHIAAFWSLLFIGIPTLWNYASLLLGTLSAGYESNPYAFTDALVMGLLVFGIQGLGIFLWINSLRHPKRS